MNLQLVNTFIDNVRSHLKEYGICLVLEPTEFVLTNNIQVSGYFSENESTLKVATNKPLDQWLSILVHEYAHFLQYTEQSPEYRNVQQNNYINQFDLWINHKLELNDNEKLKVFNALFQLERDCELRALSLIAEHNLPIDSKEYIQKANSYLKYYSSVFKHRVWNGVDLPYNHPQIYSQMPNQKLIEEFIYEIN